MRSVNALETARELMEIHDTQVRDLSRCLHDEIGQLLAALFMHLHLAKDSGADCPHLTTCMTIAQQAIQQVRKLSSDLHPSVLEHLTLPDALRCVLDQRSRSDGVAIDVLTSRSWCPWPAIIEMTCFCAAMEAVEDAISRMGARRILVELRQDAEAVELTVHDDGSNLAARTFQNSNDGPPQGGFGAVCRRIELLGGHWRIESRTGQGATVHIRLPVGSDAASS